MTGMPDSTYGRMVWPMSGTVETEGLIAGLGYRPYHCVRRQAVRRVGERDGLRYGWGSGELRDVGDGYPVVVMSCMHVAHACPDGDLGAGADPGVLLKEGSAGDLQPGAEKVGVEIGAASYGGLHVEAVAETGEEDRSAHRGG